MTTATSSTSRRFDLRGLMRSSDALMAVGVIAIIGIMIVPLPAALLDLLVEINLALSIGVMLLNLYIKKPMEFSVFPTVCCW